MGGRVGGGMDRRGLPSCAWSPGMEFLPGELAAGAPSGKEGRGQLWPPFSTAAWYLGLVLVTVT